MIKFLLNLLNLNFLLGYIQNGVFPSKLSPIEEEQLINAKSVLDEPIDLTLPVFQVLKSIFGKSVNANKAAIFVIEETSNFLKIPLCVISFVCSSNAKS